MSALDGFAHQKGMQDKQASAQLANQQRREIYTYEAPWTIYSLAFSQREEADRKFRLALGSFVEEYTNRVSIVQRCALIYDG